MNVEPAWLTAARALVGTREAPGSANNPTILGWGKRLGVKVLGIVYGQDATPWCGVFCAYVMQQAGVAPPSIAVRAKSWATWGQPVQPGLLMPGTVLVFDRAGGGHVTLYLGEDATTYACLGGNQGDAVSITRIAKNRCIARRWPKDQPMIGRPVQMAAGGAVSRNEA